MTSIIVFSLDMKLCASKMVYRIICKGESLDYIDNKDDSQSVIEYRISFLEIFAMNDLCDLR